MENKYPNFAQILADNKKLKQEEEEEKRRQEEEAERIKLKKEAERLKKEENKRLDEEYNASLENIKYYDEYESFIKKIIPNLIAHLMVQEHYCDDDILKNSNVQAIKILYPLDFLDYNAKHLNRFLTDNELGVLELDEIIRWNEGITCYDLRKAWWNEIQLYENAGKVKDEFVKSYHEEYKNDEHKYRPLLREDFITFLNNINASEFNYLLDKKKNDVVYNRISAYILYNIQDLMEEFNNFNLGNLEEKYLFALFLKIHDYGNNIIIKICGITEEEINSLNAFYQNFYKPATLKREK